MTPDRPVDLWLDPHALGSVTDLYQLTMMAGYDRAGMSDHRAVFEIFVRQLPPRRSYLVFAGLEQAIGSLEQMRFSESQVADLRSQKFFAEVSPKWFDRLLDFRFEGDLWAVPEGTVVFPGEPLVRIEATLPQAQLVETMLLASLGYPTLVASKAARIVQAAAGRGVIDFGTRRGHGLQASFLAARAAAIAGFIGTSQVEASRRLGIPALGTMAHSWVQAFPSEELAFQEFARTFPHSTLLVDTYDTATGVHLAAQVKPPIRAIRIDSGDLLVESRQARRILDEQDRQSVEIVGSGDLDEDSIAQLVANEAPIDQFGVGTELITSGGAPAISMVYKLVEINGAGRVKLSPGKRTYPLAKQTFRQFDANGKMSADHVVRAGEILPNLEPLLQQQLAAGRLVRELPTLEAIQERCRTQLSQLPESLRSLESVERYPVSYSALLQAEASRLSST